MSRGVRFRTQYYRLARKARLNLPSANFYAIHLRVEQEALQIFGKGAFVLNGSALDACLVSTHGWNWSAPNSTLYVSAGPSVFAYPEVQRWLNATRFRHVVHLGTLLKNSAISHLGREEWGIVEALVCVHARSYAAFSVSSRSMYVRLHRRHQRKKKNDTSSDSWFFWDHCSGALSASDAAVTQPRIKQEHRQLFRRPRFLLSLFRLFSAIPF